MTQSVKDALADAETLREQYGAQAAQTILRERYHSRVVHGGYEHAENWLATQSEYARLRCACGECGRAGRAWADARTRHAPYGAPLGIGACAYCAAGDAGVYSPPESSGSWVHRTLMQGTVLCARAAFRAVPALRGEE